MRAKAIYWNEKSFINANIPIENIIAGTTTRIGGYSSAPWTGLNMGTHVGDERGCVERNRTLLKQALVLNKAPFWLEQVHGNKVVEVIDETMRLPRADGAYSYQKDIPLVVQTADCLPIIFAATNSDWIAIAHCGWRSLANNILTHVINSFNGNPKQIIAWFGPCISQENFQVGENVIQAFASFNGGELLEKKHFMKDEEGQWKADLFGLAEQQLRLLSIQNIFSAKQQLGYPCCTFDDDIRFFSYRRTQITGRMVTVICRLQG